MGKLKQQVPSSSEEELESYGSEDLEEQSEMGEMEDIEDEMSSQDVREVDKDHILNYQSDSSDQSDGEESSLDAKMEKQKASLRMNDAWGKNKKSYYKNKEDSDEDESSDEDQAIEAERLQKIRREKLAR
jgi:hypothetical protein